MEYTFAAERKLVFVVQCGGRNRLVEFGDRNISGASVFITTDPNVAQAIRRSSLSRRGVIVETTKPQEPAPEKASQTNTNTTQKTQSPQEPASPEVRPYENFTLAREAIIKEFGLKKSEVRNPTALARVAQEHGFTIKYLNAEK